MCEITVRLLRRRGQMVGSLRMLSLINALNDSSRVLLCSTVGSE
jgi:hypothetical protein